MASILQRARRQAAVYWAQSAGPGEYGKRSYAAPVQIACRWDDAVKQVRNKDGETVTSSASIIVDRDMKPGDMLALGEVDSSTVADPTDSGSGAAEIISMERIPPLRRGETAYIAYL